MSRFVEDFAGWGNEAVSEFSPDHLQLDKQQDPFNVALQDIILTATK